LSKHGDLGGALHKLESHPGSLGNFPTCLTLYSLQNWKVLCMFSSKHH